MGQMLKNGTSQRLVDLLKDRSCVILDPTMTDPRLKAFAFFLSSFFFFEWLLLL
jgi:hypothetical protein